MISDFYKGRLSSITSFTRFHKTKHMITYTVTTFSFVDELELKDKAVFLSEVLFLVALIFSWVRKFMQILKSRCLLPSDVLFCFVLAIGGRIDFWSLEFEKFQYNKFHGLTKQYLIKELFHLRLMDVIWQIGTVRQLNTFNIQRL